jgi:hypothetical protein
MLTSSVGVLVIYVALEVIPNWSVPLPTISSPSGIGTVYLSHALAVAGVAEPAEKITGVELVITAPTVFILRLNVVVWIVAVTLPLVATDI